MRRAFPDLGSAIYFEIAERTHAVLYELPRQRLNWLWCALVISGPLHSLQSGTVMLRAILLGIMDKHVLDR